jgi:hypothetical protein
MLCVHELYSSKHAPTGAGQRTAFPWRTEFRAGACAKTRTLQSRCIQSVWWVLFQSANAASAVADYAGERQLVEPQWPHSPRLQRRSLNEMRQR